MALLTRPAILIADEPTTALDATLEVQIINLLKELQQDLGCSIVFVSHHLGTVAELCDDVVVMYAGEVVETGAVRDIFQRARPSLHPGAVRVRSRADQGERPGRCRRSPATCPTCATCRRAASSATAAPRLWTAAATSTPIADLAGPRHVARCHLLGGRTAA